MSMTNGTDQGSGSRNSTLPGIFNGSESSSMRAVERAAAEVAPTDLPIFIVGEGGTGKGTLATLIHRLSHRSGEELVKVNCQHLPAASMTKNPARSPLGLSDRQLRGTVLLDEVLELQPALQTQVLAILPDEDIEPHQIRTIPRVIAATRIDNGTQLSGSPFSRELYYRLRGVLLRIPPLRERREDIPLLAHFLLNKHSASFGRTGVRLSARAEEQFQRHQWPGNVRELENAIKTLIAVNDEDLVLESIGFSSASGTVGTNGHRTESSDSPVFLKDASRIASRLAEKQLISEVLQRTSWNRKRAAKELNISYKALLYKLKQNGLSGPTTTEEQPSGRGTAK
jgi:two-component system response regulator AtoC